MPLPDVYLSRNENSVQMYGFDPKDADSRYKRLAADTPNVTMGPMPVAAFMNQFLPALGSLVECMPSCEHAFDGIKAQNEHESDIYPILVSISILYVSSPDDA